MSKGYRAEIEREAAQEVAADRWNVQFDIEEAMHGWLTEPAKYVREGIEAQAVEQATTKEQRLAFQKKIYDLAQAYAPECGGYTNVPNWYWDRLQGLLPPAYFGIAMYGWRRTVGMGKLTDRIANKQFMTGAMMHNGELVRDYGCGISKDTVTAGRNFLHQAGVMVEIAPNNAPDNDGPKIRIEIDPSKINWQFLFEEKAKRAVSGKKQTSNGIEGRKKKSHARRNTTK